MADLAGRVVVVSPHLDDAVLSCGELISRLEDCVVLTVFAGSPPSWKIHREWDNDDCGFAEGTDVVAARVREDDNALGSLGAAAARLTFLDEQYREPRVDPAQEELGAEIAASIDRIDAATALMPLGLGHKDHHLTAAGCRHAALNGRHLEWFAYLDIPYGYEPEIFGPQAVDEGLCSLSPLVPRTIEFGHGTGAEAKMAALDHYPSQMRGLGARRSAALKPERYWKLEPPRPANLSRAERVRTGARGATSTSARGVRKRR
jgi:LmbE family N-acetylglucosaminyl deacetylase